MWCGPLDQIQQAMAAILNANLEWPATFGHDLPFMTQETHVGNDNHVTGLLAAWKRRG